MNLNGKIDFSAPSYSLPKDGLYCSGMMKMQTAVDLARERKIGIFDGYYSGNV